MADPVVRPEPETEGELYDRLLAVEAECETLARVVGALASSYLDAARTNIAAARHSWMSE